MRKIPKTFEWGWIRRIVSLDLTTHFWVQCHEGMSGVLPHCGHWSQSTSYFLLLDGCLNLWVLGPMYASSISGWGICLCPGARFGCIWSRSLVGLFQPSKSTPMAKFFCASKALRQNLILLPSPRAPLVMKLSREGEWWDELQCHKHYEHPRAYHFLLFIRPEAHEADGEVSHSQGEDRPSTQWKRLHKKRQKDKK